MTGTMSKALEAAHEAGVRAFENCRPIDDGLIAYRDALLAHLAEDEAVVERAAEHLQSAGQKWATNDDRTPYWPMLARAALKSLAGKE